MRALLQDVRSLRVLSSILLLSSLASSSFALALPSRVPGTKVWMEPPAGFVPSARFPGFENAASAASIVVTELPGPASTMRQGMTSETLASRGMTLLHRETLKVDDQDAVLLQVSQSQSGADFSKWILIGGDDSKCVMIVAAFPAGLSDLVPVMRRAVLSATWSGGGGAKRAINPYEGLLYRVDGTKALRLAGRMGNLLVFSETGSMEPAGAQDAMLFVGNSMSEVKIDDLEAFARERAGKTARVGPLLNAEGRAVRADGLSGYELVGDTNDLKSRKALRMYQLVLADDANYYLAQGFVSPERSEAMLPEFRKITASFRRLHPPK
jgi:hypothetical protein